MAGEVKTIQIQYCDKTLTVEVLVRGKFAAHAIDGSPLKYIKPSSWYAVSHVATGRKVCEIEGRDVAVKLAKQLDGLLTEDFTADDFSGVWSERYASFFAKAKPIVQVALGVAH